MSVADRPLVTVIIPSYNHERFVEQAVRSVWAQTYPNVELVVLDDGSRDATPDIIERLVPESPIPMRFVRKENEGVCRTLNRGLEMARGEWIATLASDDFYPPEKLAEQVAHGEALGPEYGCIHTDSYMVSETGEVMGRTYDRSLIPPAEGDAFLAFANGAANVIACSALFHARWFREVGGFDETLVSEDFEFHLRLSRVAKYAYIDRPLLNSRQLATSFGRSPRTWIHDGVRALDKHRDALGEHYAEAVRLKSIRNVGVCVYNGYPAGAAEYTVRALKHSRTPRALANTVQTVGVSVLGHIAKRTLSRVVPAPVEEFAKRKLARYIIR